MARSRLPMRAGRDLLDSGVVSGRGAPPARASRGQRAPVAAPHAVRIIGGQWKRRRLPVLDVPGLRPTADRVRETLFNWLAHQAGGDLGGWRCVDAFAGTGALGLEAASRGASAVLLVESSRVLVRHLQAAVQMLQANQVEVRHADGVTALRQLPRHSQQLVFLDPPFASEAQGVYAAALDAAREALAPHGLLYLEAGRVWSESELAERGWQRIRYLKAGQVHAHLLAPAPELEVA